MTSTRSRAETETEAEAEPLPFGDPATTTEVVALQQKLATAMSADAQVRVLTPGEGGQVLQVDQDALVGNAFCVTGVQITPVVSNYETGEVDFHLATFSAQAVKLDPKDNHITRRGAVVVCVGGRIDPDEPDVRKPNNSVLGRELLELQLYLDPSPQRPVLVTDGLRKVVTAGGGAYYTMRGRPAEHVDLFPD